VFDWAYRLIPPRIILFVYFFSRIYIWLFMWRKTKSDEPFFTYDFHLVKNEFLSHKVFMLRE